MNPAFIAAKHIVCEILDWLEASDVTIHISTMPTETRIAEIIEAAYRMQPSGKAE